MTIVPPTDRVIRSNVDQTAANASAGVRVDTVQNERVARRKVTARIEYHHPAMSFLVDPSQHLFARRLVSLDKIVIF